MPSDLDRIALARLRSDGQRYTANRRRLLAILARAQHPLTIPDILASPDVTDGERLAQSSVYRNLGVLERAGVVRRVVTSDDWARYELAEDLTEHHHHLICSSCGLVLDFTVSHELERAIDAALRHVAADARFTFDHHRLDVVGRCRRCVAEGQGDAVSGAPT